MKGSEEVSIESGALFVDAVPAGAAISRLEREFPQQDLRIAVAHQTRQRHRLPEAVPLIEA